MVTNTLDQRLNESGELLSEHRIGMLMLAVIAGLILGWFLFAPDQPLERNGYLTNAFTEAISVLLTVFVLNEFNKRREVAETKKRLIRQAGSVNHQIAINAVEELRANGWLKKTDKEPLLFDASLAYANLANAKLAYANLEGADLAYANLEGADLAYANLEGANLPGANLANANLGAANLANADLNSANLTNASLQQTNLAYTQFWNVNLSKVDFLFANLANTYLGAANLVGANLKSVTFDGHIVLPDAQYVGSDAEGKMIFDRYWTPRTDMSRYTNPEHPDFWQPNWAKKSDES